MNTNLTLFSLSTGAIVGIVAVSVVALLLIILVVSIINMRNGFVRIANSCDEAWATIDVYLKKRYDLIPNLVETVKGYAKHEGQTLQNVISARNAAMTATDPNAKIGAENMLTGTLKTLFSLTENYPDLKANAQFMQLQAQLQTIETDLAQARKYYNGMVKSFNTKIQLFPQSIIANFMRLTKRDYFELDSAEEKQNVKVSF